MAEIELETIALGCRINNKKGRKNARQIFPIKVCSWRSENNQSNEILVTIVNERVGDAHGVVGTRVVRRGKG
jgi:hypothetical protein